MPPAEPPAPGSGFGGAAEAAALAVAAKAVVLAIAAGACPVAAAAAACMRSCSCLFRPAWLAWKPASAIAFGSSPPFWRPNTELAASVTELAAPDAAL